MSVNGAGVFRFVSNRVGTAFPSSLAVLNAKRVEIERTLFELIMTPKRPTVEIFLVKSILEECDAEKKPGNSFDGSHKQCIDCPAQ